MAKLYGEIAAKSLLTLDKSFARANGQPLDASEVYYSLEAAKTYAAGAQAYIGQKIVVVENGVVTHYGIEDTAGTLKELGAKPVGDEKSIVVAANGTVSLKGVGTLVFERDILGEDDQPTGEKEYVQYQPLMTKDGLVWVEPSKTTVEGLATLLDALTKRVDTAEKDIDALEAAVGVAAKPESTEGAGDAVAATGLFKAIDDEIARATAAEEALGKRIDAIDYVDNDELTEALGDYVTTEAFNTFKGENTQAIADAKSGAEKTASDALAAARTEISKEIDDDVKIAKDRADEAYALAETKVDAETYATDKKALEDEDAAIREIAEAAKASIDTFLDGEGVADVVDSLKDIKAELDKMADATEMVDALALKADKTALEGVEGRVKAIEDAPYVTKGQLDTVDGKFANYTDTEALTDLLAGKQDNIPENTYDAYGAAATAKAEAIADAEGKIATAKQEAIDAAAGDATTKANQALADAKADAATLYATKEYVGTIPNDAEGNPKAANVVAYIEAKAAEVLSQATGGSSESAASVKAQLDTFKAEINPKVTKNTEDIATINEKLKDIEANADVNIIETVKVNGKELTPDENKAVDITVPTKFSDITDDSGFDARITAAQTQADKGVNDASAAQTTANEAAAQAAANLTAIGTVNTTVAGHTESINDHASRITTLENFKTSHEAAYETLNGIVSGHTSDIAKKANQTDLDAAVARISTNEGAIKTLNETTIPGINTEIGKKANAADVYTKTEVNAITGTPTDGKTLVQMIEAAQTAATYDDTAIKADIKKNTDAIAVLNGDDKTEGSVDYKVAQEVAKILNDNDSSDIDTLNEIAAWITSDTTGAAKMNADIAANTAAIAKLNGTAETEGSILAMIEANAPKIATDTVPGLVMGSDAENKVAVAADGTMEVNSVNVNKLVQDENSVLILNGGKA
jgi:hypothetical protein